MERSRIRWTHIAVTLIVVWIIGMIDKVSVGIVMANKDFLSQTGLLNQPVKLGMLTTAMLVSYTLGFPIWAEIMRHLSPRRTLLAGLCIWALSVTGFGLADSFVPMLAWRIVLGFGEAVLFPVCHALVYEWFPDHERARASSIWWSGSMIGPALAGFSLVGIMNTFGWRMPFFILGAATLLITVPLTLLCVRNKPSDHPACNAEERHYIASGRDSAAPFHGKDDHRRAGGYAFLKDYRLWVISGAFFFNNVFFWAWSTWLPTYLHQSRGFPLQAMGNLTSLIYGVSLFTIYGSAFWSDRVMRRAPFGAAGYLAAGCLVFLAVLIPDAALSVILLTGTLAFQQVGCSMLQPLLQRLVDINTVGRAAGVMNFLGQMGSIVGPLSVGLLIQASGGSFIVSFGMMSIALICAGIMIATLISQHL
jgi:MFS transporter, ACS family, glucarate transporter